MAELTVRDLLLAPRLERTEVAFLLAPYGVKDPGRADVHLQAAAGPPAERQMLAGILEPLLAAVARSGDPDRAVTYFSRFAEAAINRAQLFSYLGSSPQATEILARTLGGSPYMSEILIRDPQHFYWVSDPQILTRARQKREIQRELLRSLKLIGTAEAQFDYLRSVKRREMLHIGVRDLLRLSTVEDTLAALSHLAEALISAAYAVCAIELRREWRIPPGHFQQFTVLAMGKLGGGELNFSSDVDLMYLYGSDAEESAGVSAPDYFNRLARMISAGLNARTAEGYVYRVDLRLRPEGDSGYPAYSMAAFERYYASRLATWERLALLKARPVAGDRALGRQFLTMARHFIFGTPFDQVEQEEVRAMKRKIDEKMTRSRQRDRNVKLGTGGIREIELIAQTLQIGGKGMSNLWPRNTLDALATLSSTGSLSVEDSEILRKAYVFLRDVENKLQMVDDAQTHALPEHEEELLACARLLGYSTLEDFRQDYQRHTGNVNRLFEKIV
jgi:glutamate-ammonia-ligase adenylyltransferase